jgi:hypothetical protein
MRTHYGNWVVGAERSYRWFNHGPGEFEQDLIVVVPGWDGAPSSGQIERLVKRLAPHGAVLVPLLRGTDRYNPDWSFWTMRRHAMDIAALLTRQVAHGIIDRTTRFSMASHSLGAMATLTFASAASRLAPDVPDLDLMVLFGTSLGLPNPLPKQAPLVRSRSKQWGEWGGRVFRELRDLGVGDSRGVGGSGGCVSDRGMRAPEGIVAG